MDKEKALARLLLLEVQLTKEVNSPRGETKKTLREYDKSLKEVCDIMSIDPEAVMFILNPR